MFELVAPTAGLTDVRLALNDLSSCNGLNSTITIQHL